MADYPGIYPEAHVSTVLCHLSVIQKNCTSLVGRWGFRAPPGNQFLIAVSRLEKYHRKLFAMLKS